MSRNSENEKCLGPSTEGITDNPLAFQNFFRENGRRLDQKVFSMAQVDVRDSLTY